MKQRIVTGWIFIRILYLLAGVMVLIQSVTDRQWIGIALGVYFASMGLFAVGCAAGSCYYQLKPKNKQNFEETEFEEIK